MSIKVDEKEVLRAKYANHKSLLQAIEEGDIDKVKYMFKFNIDVTANGHIAFYNAIMKERLDIVEYLLTTSEDIAFDRYDVFEHFCKLGNFKICKFLIDKGMNCRHNDYYIFRIACEYGQLKIAEAILTQVNFSCIYNTKEECVRSLDNCALKKSAANGHLDVVNFLLMNNADISAGNYEAFRLAYNNKHDKVAEYLLDILPDIDEKIKCIQSLQVN